MKIFYEEHYEVLNGRVRQIVTSGANLMGSPILIAYSDTILYDRHGNQTEIRFRKRDGFSDIKILNNIPKGEPYTVENPFPGGIGKSVTKYDGKGAVIEKSEYNSSGLFKKQEYSYNAVEQVAEVRTYNNLNALQQKVVFHYNDEGILTGEDHFPGNNENYDSQSIFKYDSFDDKHNWLKRIKTEKVLKNTTSVLTDTVSRKITYY